MNSATTTVTSLTDPAIQRLVEDYRTAELTTIAKDGTPITWPVVVSRTPGTSELVFTTSIGLPVKAFHLRRDPHVSLLFSDPTGSGLDHPARVLVQGLATCSDEVVTDPAPLQHYWRRLYERQPVAKSYCASAVGRWYFDWYLMRLVVAVRPTRVTVDSRPIVPVSRNERPRPLREYESAVLTTVGPDGSPSSMRVVPTVAADGAYDLGEAGPVDEGPASLLGHGHDDRLWGLQSVLVVGQVIRKDGRLRFEVRRVIPGASRNPLKQLATLRRARGSAARYLARRGLARPDVPWEAYAQLHD